MYSPRIYTYKITFEEVPYYYYGVKKEKYFNQTYWGSPHTNKWCWEFYTPKKQILEFFEHTDSGYIEAQKVEKKLIAPSLNDVWCLNENVGGLFSLRISRDNGRKVSLKNKENSIGIFSLTEKQLSENGRKGGKIGGEVNKLNKSGICGLSLEERQENAKKSHQTQKELGLGIYVLNKEELSKNGKKGGKITSSQRWMCLETEFVSTASGLMNYQKSRGIDTSKRKRIL
jgi:hypothetical protein